MFWIWKPLTWTLLLVGLGSCLQAQAHRIARPIDPSRVVALDGNVRPATLLQNDAGPVDDNFPLPAMGLFLKRSPVQQAELLQLLEAQRNSASPLYHHWLTPEKFADRFGLGQDDIGLVEDWLRAQGFSVRKVARSRTWIVFGGTARQVKDTFHTEIHQYSFAGESHFANVTAPSVPRALAEVMLCIDGLDDFFLEDQPKPAAQVASHELTPDDLATIYNIVPVYQAGIDGDKQKIAVVGGTQLTAQALADIAAFRSNFNLPPNVPEEVLDTDYPDPGVNENASNEARGDIEWSGAIARNAEIICLFAVICSRGALRDRQQSRSRHYGKLLQRM
jgi:subtilase family serine protease